MDSEGHRAVGQLRVGKIGGEDALLTLAEGPRLHGHQGV